MEEVVLVDWVPVLDDKAHSKRMCGQTPQTSDDETRAHTAKSRGWRREERKMVVSVGTRLPASGFRPPDPSSN